MSRPAARLLPGLLLALAAAGALADEPPPEAPPELPPARYLTSPELGEALRALAVAAEAAGVPARVLTYGESGGGRPLVALRLGGPWPTVFVHGGLGRRDAAAAVACLRLAERVVAGEGDSRLVSWLLVPAPNPDALDRFLAGAWPHGGIHVDRDRDGRLGEDGPSDVDGDGEVLRMRRLAAGGAWAVVPPPGAGEGEGAAADDRLLAEQGVDARRVRSYEAFDEGLDEDGDGLVNEDPPGLDLTRQLVGKWEDKAPWRGDGPFPGLAPEAKALLDLTLEERRLVAWYAFTGEGPYVVRATPPDKAADGDLLGRIAEAVGGAAARPVKTAADLPDAANPGSDLDWATTHLGLPAFRIPVWWIAKEEGYDAKREVADERDWLLWNDRILGGRGFRAWTPFGHPTLGAVEIGGWTRFSRFEPPEALLGEAVGAASRVPLAGARFRPALRLDVGVEVRGEGRFEVRALVLNAGEGPTDTRTATDHSRGHGVRVRFRPAEGVEVLAGPRAHDAGRLDPGAVSESARWLVRGAGGGALGAVEARHPRAGSVEVEVLP